MIKIIVVLGLPGSGKSFFAEALSSRLGVVHINSDQLRKALSAQGKYSIEDKLSIYRAMTDDANEILVKGRTVVVDATFYQLSMVDLFVDLAKKRSCLIFFIKIEAEENLIKTRLSRPRRDSEADYSVYLKVKAEFEELLVPHLRLQSENDNIDCMLELAVEYIGSIHE